MRLLLLALTFSGCTCLTQFDPDSQPCEPNAPVGQQCLSGFQCVAGTQPDAGVCRRLDGGITDAGP
jgi:hypothetical protein